MVAYGLLLQGCCACIQVSARYWMQVPPASHFQRRVDSVPGLQSFLYHLTGASSGHAIHPALECVHRQIILNVHAVRPHRIRKKPRNVLNAHCSIQYFLYRRGSAWPTFERWQAILRSKATSSCSKDYLRARVKYKVSGAASR